MLGWTVMALLVGTGSAATVPGNVSSDAASRCAAEDYLQALLRLRAAQVTSVFTFLGMRMDVTPTEPGPWPSSFVFAGGYAVEGWNIIRVVVREADVARRAYRYLQLIRAYEEAAGAGIALIPELESLAYGGDWLEELRLRVAKRTSFHPFEVDREAAAMFARYDLPHITIDGRLRYTHVHDLACMLLAFEFCHFDKCSYFFYKFARSSLCPFDFDYGALFGRATRAEPGFTPSACQRRSAEFARRSELYTFLADYVARGPQLHAGYGRLRRGVERFAPNADVSLARPPK